MAEIFKGVGKAVGGLLGGLGGLLGAKAPKAPTLLNAPTYNNNAQAAEAAAATRRKQQLAFGRNSTLLSVNTSQAANPGLEAPTKSLLGV